MDKCLWIGAGYPILITGIVALWVAFKKSQEALLAEKESKVTILSELRVLLLQKKRKDGGEPPGRTPTRRWKT